MSQGWIMTGLIAFAVALGPVVVLTLRRTAMGPLNAAAWIAIWGLVIPVVEHSYFGITRHYGLSPEDGRRAACSKPTIVRRSRASASACSRRSVPREVDLMCAAASSQDMRRTPPGASIQSCGVRPLWSGFVLSRRSVVLVLRYRWRARRNEHTQRLAVQRGVLSLRRGRLWTSLNR